MKHIVLISALVTSSAFAKDAQVTLFCETAKAMSDAVQGSYKEEPKALFRNPDEKTETVLYYNEKTTTWTLVHFDRLANVGCIIGSGKGISWKYPKNST